MTLTNKALRSLEPRARGAAVTPDDEADLANPGTLFISTGGTLAIVTTGGDTLSMTVTDGTQLVLWQVARVLATGTTATGILVAWAE